MRAHEAVGPGDQAGAPGVVLAELRSSDGRVRRRTRWLYRRRARMEGNRSRGRGAVRSGLQTGLSTAAVSGSAAVLGVILSRKFGHGVKTDGFFAAYGVYLALVLVAGSLRVVVLPRFVAARAAGRLGRRGRNLGRRARAAARRGGRAGGGLAARDRERADLERRARATRRPCCCRGSSRRPSPRSTAASSRARSPRSTTTAGPRSGSPLGSVAGVLLTLALVDHGVVAFGWGLALNGALSLAIPLVAAARAARRRAARLTRVSAGCSSSAKGVVAARRAAGPLSRSPTGSRPGSGPGGRRRSRTRI